MKKHMFMALLLIALLGAIPAHAIYSCTGTVTFLGVNKDGGVNLSLAGQFSNVYICQLGGTTPNGYTSDACKASYAYLLSHKLSGQSVTVYFADDGHTCTTQPQYVEWSSAYFVANQ